MNEVRKVLQADLYRYRADTGRSALRSAYIHEPGFRYIYHLRKVAYYASRKKSFWILAYVYHRIQLNRYRFRYGFDISPTTRIAPGLFLGHCGGVIISPEAVLGANVNINQGVTIGAESRGRRKGAPALGQRVWVGANAVIVGKITIGDDALIAPGAFVNFDVPSKAIVLGNPGKIVAMTGSAGYVNNILDEARS